VSIDGKMSASIAQITARLLDLRGELDKTCDLIEDALDQGLIAEPAIYEFRWRLEVIRAVLARGLGYTGPYAVPPPDQDHGEGEL
jgi:hypothetical protein